MTERQVLVILLRWIARLGSLCSIGLMVLMFFDSPALPRPQELIAMVFFPGAVVCGMVIGWWKERDGGAITLAGLLGFYLWMLLLSATLPSTPWFVVFASPGLLMGVCGLLDPRRKANSLAGPARISL